MPQQFLFVGGPLDGVLRALTDQEPLPRVTYREFHDPAMHSYDLKKFRFPGGTALAYFHSDLEYREGIKRFFLKMAEQVVPYSQGASDDNRRPDDPSKTTQPSGHGHPGP